MALNKVEICGVNTSKLPVLKAEEKEELFRRIKEGDEEARELYIKGNLRLVLSVIKRFSNSSENMDDLFQIGCIGLIKAIDNFDTTLNVKLNGWPLSAKSPLKSFASRPIRRKGFRDRAEVLLSPLRHRRTPCG